MPRANWIAFLAWMLCCAGLILLVPHDFGQTMGPVFFGLIFLVGALLIPNVHIHRKEKSINEIPPE